MVEKEQRRFPRASVQMDISFTDVNANERVVVRGSSVDISASGIFVKSSLFIFKANTILNLTFTLPGKESKITVRGRVMNFAVINERPGMGIEFVDIGEEDRRQIDEYVRERSKESESKE